MEPRNRECWLFKAGVLGRQARRFRRAGKGLIFGARDEAKDE